MEANKAQQSQVGFNLNSTVTSFSTQSKFDETGGCFQAPGVKARAPLSALAERAASLPSHPAVSTGYISIFWLMGCMLQLKETRVSENVSYEKM